EQLPQCRLTFHILDERPAFGGERPVFAVRPQPHINAIKAAVAGYRRQSVYKDLRRPRIKLARGNACRHRLAFIDKCEVQVRIEIQPRSAQLPQSQNAQSQLRYIDLEPTLHLSPCDLDRRFDACLGKLRLSVLRFADRDSPRRIERCNYRDLPRPRTPQLPQLP